MNKAPAKKKYRTAIEFTKDMIAPCGMNCGSCLRFMRNKNHCPGCRTYDPAKPV